jgi:hypothetical protein
LVIGSNCPGKTARLRAGEEFGIGEKRIKTGWENHSLDVYCP